MYMKNVVLNVNGMSCSHCENAVKKAVGSLEGVSSVSVNLSGKTVTVDFDEAKVTLDQIKYEIDDQGYEVVG
jgi:copper chaperone